MIFIFDGYHFHVDALTKIQKILSHFQAGILSVSMIKEKVCNSEQNKHVTRMDKVLLFFDTNSFVLDFISSMSTTADTFSTAYSSPNSNILDS